MRNHYIVLLILITSFGLKAQSSMNLDVVILINEKIVLSNMNDLTIEVKKSNGKVITHDIYYHPGSLKLEAKEEDLFGEGIEGTVLKFNFFDVGKEESIEYIINLEKNWFFDYYSILHIYNLRCKKYKKRFKPLSEDKNYTFEVDSPSHSFRRK